MLQALRQKVARDEEGFTLIELMVVVLIIAILIAIAIPTFLGARQRAQDRAAQSNVRNAFTAEKTFYTDAQVYTASASARAAIEPSLNFTGTGRFGDGVNKHRVRRVIHLEQRYGERRGRGRRDERRAGTGQRFRWVAPPAP